jgi:DNA invertase Pin-like site-specific DNA recombinase
MTTVGYARVSSVGQDLEVQLEKLSSCDKVFKEKRFPGWMPEGRS